MNFAQRLLILFTCLFTSGYVFSQQKFTRYDYLHGKLNPLRTCFDVKHYDIHVKVNPAKKYISGKNEISFRVIKDFNRFQLDFSSEMVIDSIVYNHQKLSFQRDSNATFVNLKSKLKKGTRQAISVYFSGNPHVAKKAPWDGGFVWAKDSSGYDWVGLACEGIGASIWLPCKDHWSDEADSMDMHLSVPSSLVGVSNGRLVDTSTTLIKGYKTYHWKVVNPINNYSISINAGHYVHLADGYYPRYSFMPYPLDLDYFVLSYNKTKAAMHFRQVQDMLQCYERFFGVYPFWEDGYKLVETPYWGMEHQSAVAYGNDYYNNRYNFDFIIIHESAHEWFANSITASDPADMWIHESFTTYAEALYVECTMGMEASVKYLKEQKKNIENKEPMIGPRDVYYHGRTDNDIYYKGTWMLHTMRSVIDNDSAWFAALKGFCARFKNKIITTNDVLKYFNEVTGRKWDAFFQQYLYTASLPVFEYRTSVNSEGNIVLKYKWSNTVKDFDMPVKVTMTKGKWDVVTPLKSWQLIDLNFFEEKDFKIQTDHYLIDVKKLQ